VSATENGDAVSEHGPGAGNGEPTVVPSEQPTAVASQPSADPSPEPKAQQPPDTDPVAIERIAARARRLVRERLRAVMDERTTARQRPSELGDELLDRIADEEADRADGALLHVAVVHAVSEELGIEIEDALEHPAVSRVRELLAPVDEAGRDGATTAGDDGARVRPPLERALLLDAVHVFGIETLEPGDRDIELRLADAGIDVRKPSAAETIGRLRWNEVRTVAVQRPRRGLPGRRRPAVFVAGTDRGEVTFELPGVSDDEITDHLEPLIARNCAGYPDPSAG
jgi:hypothetical protein